MKFRHDQQMDQKYYRIFVPELMLVSFHEKCFEMKNIFPLKLFLKIAPSTLNFARSNSLEASQMVISM